MPKAKKIELTAIIITNEIIIAIFIITIITMIIAIIVALVIPILSTI